MATETRNDFDLAGVERVDLGGHTMKSEGSSGAFKLRPVLLEQGVLCYESISNNSMGSLYFISWATLHDPVAFGAK